MENPSFLRTKRRWPSLFSSWRFLGIFLDFFIDIFIYHNKVQYYTIILVMSDVLTVFVQINKDGLFLSLDTRVEHNPTNKNWLPTGLRQEVKVTVQLKFGWVRPELIYHKETRPFGPPGPEHFLWVNARPFTLFLLLLCSTVNWGQWLKTGWLSSFAINP